jgi:HK97 family phage major capsid protein
MMDERSLLALTQSGQHARAASMLLRQAHEEFEAMAKAEKRFSYRRAFLACGAGSWDDIAPDERLFSDGICKEFGVQTRHAYSFFTPLRLQRDMTVATSSAGGYLVSPAVEARLGVPGASNSVFDLCTIIRPSGTSRSGTQRVGKFTALPTVTTLASESATISEVSPVTAQSLLSPCHTTTYIEESRQFALQSEGGAQAIAQMETNALRTDAGAKLLVGSGSAGEPLGLLNDTTVSTTSGTTLTMAAIATTMETVEKSAGDGALTWIVTSAAAKILRQRAVISGGAAILADAKIGGYSARIIGGTTDAVAAFGKWSDLLIFEWAPIEIAINPFAQFQQAIIGVRGWLAWNFAPLVASSFATISAIT